jgi:hypothetical protein
MWCIAPITVTFPPFTLSNSKYPRLLILGLLYRLVAFKAKPDQHPVGAAWAQKAVPTQRVGTAYFQLRLFSKLP